MTASPLQTSDRDSKAAAAPRSVRRFALPIVAVVLCAGTVAYLVRSIAEVTRPVERPKLAYELTPQAAAPASPAASTPTARKSTVPPPNATFEPVATADDAQRLAAAAVTRFSELAAKVEGLSSTPIQTGDQIGDSVNAFLSPLLSDAAADHAGFLRANGAQPEHAAAVARMLQGIGGVLRFCSLDLSKAFVQRTPPLPKAVAAQLKQFSPGAAAFSMSESSGPDGKVCSLTIPLATILPGANANVADDAAQIELVVPAKLKTAALAEKPLQLAVTMWKGPGKTWVPQFLSFHTTDMDTVRAIRDTIAPRTTSERPAPVNPSGG